MSKVKMVVAALAVMVLAAGCYEKTISTQVPGRTFVYKKGDLEFHCKRETAKHDSTVKVDPSKLVKAIADAASSAGILSASSADVDTEELKKFMELCEEFICKECSSNSASSSPEK